LIGGGPEVVEGELFRDDEVIDDGCDVPPPEN
jgi:hypothetical protein